MTFRLFKVDSLSTLELYIIEHGHDSKSCYTLTPNKSPQTRFACVSRAPIGCLEKPTRHPEWACIWFSRLFPVFNPNRRGKYRLHGKQRLTNCHGKLVLGGRINQA